MTRDHQYEDLRAAVERELAELEAGERPRLLAVIGAVDGRDAADRADRAVPELYLAEVEARIRRLRDRLAALDRTAVVPGNGPLTGRTVVLDFGDGPERYLLAAFPDGRTPVITPDSPLGRALVGARAGQQVTYPSPRGTATVTLVAVEGNHPAESAAG
jgi:transcription elongation factor GreA